MRNLTSIELKSGVKVQLEVLNSRMITVTPASVLYEVADENGKLTSLNFDGEYLIQNNANLTIGKQKYKITEIAKSIQSKLRYELYVFRKTTNTANFIMPLIGGNRSSFRWNMEFTNAFIGNEAECDGTKIHLLYRFNGAKDFSDFEDELKLREDYLNVEDTDKYHVLYTFSLPEEYTDDIKLIMDGKYSRISEKAKARILEFHSSNKTKTLGQVLYRCDKRRTQIEIDVDGVIHPDSELLEPFDVNKEIFKQEFIIKENGSTN